MPSYLITGTSRGLGLAFVTELVSLRKQYPLSTTSRVTLDHVLRNALA